MSEAIDGKRLRALALAFYCEVEDDPVLRPIYPNHLRCAVDNLVEYLPYLAGLPSWYGEDGRSPLIGRVHERVKIGVAERDAWVDCMSRAIDATYKDEASRTELKRFFVSAATDVMNAGSPATHPELPDGPIARNWQRVQAEEELVRRATFGDSSGIRKALAQAPNAGLTAALEAAAMWGQVHVMETLRDLGADPTRASLWGPIMGNLAGARRLLEWGGRMSWQGKPVLANVCRADKGEHPERVALLLEFGADPNDRTADGRTALHYAARAGFGRCIKLLRAAGGDPSIRDKKGRTPRDIADAHGYLNLFCVWPD